MVPGTSISVQQRRRFNSLSAVLASFALKCIVCFAKRVLVKLEKLSESVQREVTFSVFFLIDDCGG